MSLETSPGVLAHRYANVNIGLKPSQIERISEAEVDELLQEYENLREAGEVYTRLRTFTPGTRFKVL